MLLTFLVNWKMSNGRGKDLDCTYAVVKDGTNSENLYEVIGMKTANPASVYTMLDITTARARKQEGPPPENQQDGYPSFKVKTTEDSTKKDPSKTNNNKTVVSCLIALLVAFALFIFSVSFAFAFSFIEISKLRSELAILQSTSTHLAQFSLENISNTISTQQSDIDLLRSGVNDNTQFTQVMTTLLDAGHVFTSCAAIQQLFPFQPSSVTIRSGPPMALLLLHTVI